MSQATLAQEPTAGINHTAPLKQEAEKDRSRLMKVMAVGFGLVVVIVMLLLVELTSYVILKVRDNPRPFLFNSRAHGDIHVGNAGQTSYLDPHLGHALNPEATDDLGEVPGFAVYGKGGIRIVTLGGSTTGPCDPDNWPKQLQAILESKGIVAEVYNGGVQGYSSNQELLKMIRDVMPLKPDIIVSLNGVNDMGYLHSIPQHPMVHPYQNACMTSATEKEGRFFPCTTHIVRRVMSRMAAKGRRIDGISYGPEVCTTPHEQWARNIRMMHALADEFGTDYLCFLQPTMGIGNYSPTPDETDMLEYANEQRNGEYIDLTQEFYTRARLVSEEKSYCIDLTDVFAGKSGVYKDARHQNPNGYHIIADAITAEIQSRNLLNARFEQNKSGITK